LVGALRNEEEDFDTSLSAVLEELLGVMSPQALHQEYHLAGVSKRLTSFLDCWDEHTLHSHLE
jgi:hypothetical protein